MVNTQPIEYLTILKSTFLGIHTQKDAWTREERAYPPQSALFTPLLNDYQKDNIESRRKLGHGVILTAGPEGP